MVKGNINIVREITNFVIILEGSVCLYLELQIAYVWI